MNRPGRRWVLALSTLALLAGARAAHAQVDAKLQTRINKAIDRGISFLKKNQTEQGLWPFGAGGQGGAHDTGSTALAGWALLESGVPPGDPTIRKAAAALRRAAVSDTSTYHISLLILFFDKLADPEDVPLIESLAVRLMQGQLAVGGWTYEVPKVPAAEQARLQGIVTNYKGGGKMPPLPRTAKQLAPAVQAQLAQLGRAGPGGGGIIKGDNSNTQFAIVGLWVARKYGIPADPCLVKSGKHFWNTQSPRDGSWDYMIINVPGAPPGVRPEFRPGGPGGFGPPKSHAMTCAGLLGVGIGIAATNPNAKNAKQWCLAQANVKAGLQYLNAVMRNTRQADGNHYYLLWSMERVGMFYSIKDFAGADWYYWGARWLVDNQSPSGGWAGGKHADGHCDTSFALLFLRRANPFGKEDPFPKLLPEIIEKKPAPKVKEELPDLGTGIEPKDAIKKPTGPPGKGSGGRLSSMLDRRRDDPALGRPELWAAVSADSRRPGGRL
jgi:hypothetical protein